MVRSTFTIVFAVRQDAIKDDWDTEEKNKVNVIEEGLSDSILASVLGKFFLYLETPKKNCSLMQVSEKDYVDYWLKLIAKPEDFIDAILDYARTFVTISMVGVSEEIWDGSYARSHFWKAMEGLWHSERSMMPKA